MQQSLNGQEKSDETFQDPQLAQIWKNKTTEICQLRTLPLIHDKRKLTFLDHILKSAQHPRHDDDDDKNPEEIPMEIVKFGSNHENCLKL